MDCSLPDSSVHGIFQARLLERVASSFFRGSSQLRDRTHISCRWILYHWTARQAPHKWLLRRKYSTLWEISITMTLSGGWHRGPSWGTGSPLVSHPGAVRGALGQRGDSDAPPVAGIPGSSGARWAGPTAAASSQLQVILSTSISPEFCIRLWVKAQLGHRYTARRQETHFFCKRLECAVSEIVTHRNRSSQQKTDLKGSGVEVGYEKPERPRPWSQTCPQQCPGKPPEITQGGRGLTLSGDHVSRK